MEEHEVEILEDDPEVDEVVVKETVENTPLDRAAWANVVALMETQNAVLNTSLSDLRAAVEEMRGSKAASEALLAKVERRLEELEAKRLQPEEGSEDQGDPEESLQEGQSDEKGRSSKWQRHGRNRK